MPNLPGMVALISYGLSHNKQKGSQYMGTLFYISSVHWYHQSVRAAQDQFEVIFCSGLERTEKDIGSHVTVENILTKAK